MMASSALFVLAGAATLSLALVPPLRRLAWKLGLVDQPDAAAHKSHVRPTPYGGGVAIWLSVLCAHVAVGWWTGDVRGSPRVLREITCLLACATLIMATGLADDRYTLPAWTRFLVQLMATATLLWFSPRFLLPVPAHTGVQVALTLLWILALTNAFNFLDNMDALAAGIAVGVCTLLAVIAWAVHAHALLALDLALLGALGGFLIYNRPPASIFMGDAGGLFVGFLSSGAAAWLSHHIAALDAHGWLWLAPLLLFVVPLYDLLTVTCIRLYRRSPPWVGDNSHISHRLVARGLSRQHAVLAIHIATVTLALPALLLLYRSDGAFTALLLLLYAAALALIAGIDRYRQAGARAS